MIDLAILFWEKDDSESKRAKALIDQSGIVCCFVPCRGIAEPQLCYKDQSWHSVEHIIRGLAKIKKEKS